MFRCFLLVRILLSNRIWYNDTSIFIRINMRGQFYSSQIKEDVKKFVIEGKSYREITEIFGVPKSTISTWFGKTLKQPMDRKTMMEHLMGARKLAVIAIKKKWDKIRQDENKLITEKVRQEMSTYPLNNIGFCKSMLSMLYWAEGAKYEGVSGLYFVNTDPLLMKFYITLLRKCYTIDEKKFKVRIHVHYYHSIKKVKQFWSETLNIPLERFGKIYIKKRSKTKKFRRNFMGICFVYYSGSKIRKELLEIVKNLPLTIH